MRNISAVQRPTPRSSVSVVTIASSSIASSAASVGSRPSACAVASACSDAILGPLSPAPRTAISSCSTKRSAVTAPPSSADSRPQIAPAAAPEIC